MLGKVLTIQSIPPAILNCNAFLQNRILRKFRHGCYDEYMLLYTISVTIYTLVLYTGRFRALYLLTFNGVSKTWRSFVYYRQMYDVHANYLQNEYCRLNVC